MRLALAAALVALALAACGSSGSSGSAASSGSAGSPGSAGFAGSAGPGSADGPMPTPAAGGDAAPAPPAPSTAGAFPEACGEYRQTVERLARCGDALDAEVVARLRAMFERQWAGWAALPEPDRRALAEVCASSSDAVKQAAAAACGW